MSTEPQTLVFPQVAGGMISIADMIEFALSKPAEGEGSTYNYFSTRECATAQYLDHIGLSFSTVGGWGFHPLKENGDDDGEVKFNCYDFQEALHKGGTGDHREYLVRWHDLAKNLMALGEPA